MPCALHNFIIIYYYIGITICVFVRSVKQQGLYQRSGNLWPPFRVPNLPHSAYLNLNKLLHCRTMHGVLFTLLYKVCENYPPSCRQYNALFLVSCFNFSYVAAKATYIRLLYGKRGVFSALAP